MALPWVRLDANIATHDKIVKLVGDPSPKRWQAASSYMFALAWSGGQGTDGRIDAGVLPFVHGTPATARLLEKYHLWDAGTGYWQIRNFATRQELTAIAEGKRHAQKVGGIKGNCVKYHGPDCGCWVEQVKELG